MNSLAGQLEYNWERGFYSVVQDKWDDYYVVSTKSWNHGFFITEPQLTVIAAKARIGDSKEYSGDLINTLVNPVNGGWKIIENETFHPSELMGKGFQVGDKVRFEGQEWEYGGTNGGKAIISQYNQERVISMSMNVVYKDLKPVLPVEEEEHDYSLQRYSHTCDCGQWDSQLDRNNIDTLYAANFAVLGISSCNGQYVVCPKCYQKVRKNAEYQAIKTLTKSGIIKEGKISGIVNL